MVTGIKSQQQKKRKKKKITEEIGIKQYERTHQKNEKKKKKKTKQARVEHLLTKFQLPIAANYIFSQDIFSSKSLGCQIFSIEIQSLAPLKK